MSCTQKISLYKFHQDYIRCLKAQTLRGMHPRPSRGVGNHSILHNIIYHAPPLPPPPPPPPHNNSWISHLRVKRHRLYSRLAIFYWFKREELRLHVGKHCTATGQYNSVKIGCSHKLTDKTG